MSILQLDWANYSFVQWTAEHHVCAKIARYLATFMNNSMKNGSAMAMEEMQWLHMHITYLDIFRKPLNIQLEELIY